MVRKKVKRLILKSLLLLAIFSVNSYGVTNALFKSQTSIIHNTFSTTCWIAPSIPVLIYPTNNTIAGAGSVWDLNPYMDWQDSITTCPLPTTITYQYESYHDAGLTNLAYQSIWLSTSQIPAPWIPDGDYYWRVRAKDNFGNISIFSSPWKLTVDRVKPQSVITSPSNNGSNTTVFSNSWDGNISGNASDDRSGVARVDISIHRDSDDTYWNGSSWVSGSESSTRVTTIGTTNWSYLVSNHSTATTYTFTSHAVDNAGNVEDSYKLILIINPPSPKITFNLSEDKKTISFTVSSIENFAKLNYALTYETDSEPQGIIGEAELNNQSEFKKENIILGTCSTGGTCVYHQGIKNINLKVDLLDENNKITTLTASL